MQLRILGSLEVLADGSPVALGGVRQRAVLAILLLHRGEVVSVDRVVDELWGERAPATANKTVQVYVSRLRKALGEGVLVTRGGGYALELGEHEVDADRFERLAREGREALERGDPKDAAQTLRQALDLWRGPPLADFAYESFAQNEIARLEEMRLAVLEDRIDADLALGRHGALVPELESLVAEHPGRERLRGQLMLALYRSGRQAEALESYRGAQRTLVEELGLEPGPELQQLQRAILAQDASLQTPPRPGAVAARRRHGGALIALGGLLLLAAAVAAIAAVTGEDSAEPASPNSLAVIDPETNRLVTTVPTGIEPTSVSADADSVWVANRDDDSVTQVDPDAKAVLSTTPVSATVGGLAAGAGAVWITDSRATKLVRLDPAFQSTRSFRLAGAPGGILGTPYDPPIAVGDSGVWAGKDPGVAQVDPDTGRIAARVTLGNSTSAIAIGLGGVWVTDDVDNSLARIDPQSANAVTGTAPVGQGPTAVAVGEGSVWVANTQDDTVSRVDPATMAVTATIPVGVRPTAIAATGGAVWVANSVDGTVSRIDPASNQVVVTIELGESPQDITVAHDMVWATVQAAPSPPEAPPVAAEGDVAQVLVSEDPGSPDPALSSDDVAVQRAGATCALLYNYPDRPFPAGARLQPEVATRAPSISDDGRTYEFELRSGFRFSPPSNQPVTAAAFERAIERALDPVIGSYGGTLIRDIVGAKEYRDGRARRVAGVVASGQTLRIELERPVATLVERLSTPWFCAVPPDAPIDPDGVDLLPSAGPYYVASYLRNRSLVLRRNPNYGGERPQELAEIRFVIGVGDERAIEQVEAGEADYVILNEPIGTENVAAATAPRELRRLTAEYGPGSEAARAGVQQIFPQPAPVLHYFLLNERRDPFSNVRLRRAVNYAVDRRALAANSGIGGSGRPTDQYIPPGLPGFEDATIYPLAGPDLATARRLAGTEQHRALLYTCDLPNCTRHGQILRSNLARIGIKLDVRQFPIADFFARIIDNPDEPWDIAYWNWYFDYADPATWINDQFDVRSGLPTAMDDDPEFGRRMDAAARLTGDARLRAYARLDRDLAAQAAPAVPVATGNPSHFLSARMGCQVLHPIYNLDLAALCVRDEADAD